jgi:hypothetical protein
MDSIECIIIGRSRASEAASILVSSNVQAHAPWSSGDPEKLVAYLEKLPDLQLVAVVVSELSEETAAAVVAAVDGLSVEMHLFTTAEHFGSEGAAWVRAYEDHVSTSAEMPPIEIASIIKRRWFAEVDPTVPATVQAQDRATRKIAAPAVVAVIPKAPPVQQPVAEVKAASKVATPSVTRKVAVQKAPARKPRNRFLEHVVIDLGSTDGLRRAAALFAK